MYLMVEEERIKRGREKKKTGAAQGCKKPGTRGEKGIKRERKE